MDDLRRRTKELWKLYFEGEEACSLQAIDGFLDPECVVIGTGRHEFYRTMAQFVEALHQELEERKDIRFRFENFWCEQQPATAEACLVYGGFSVWGENGDKSLQINMDSRFSMLYKRSGAGWKVVHIHQSIPNVEQMDGEYYPKTLSQQVKQSQAKIAELTELAQTDSLTHLINFRTFRKCYQSWDRDNSWLFIIDVDKFKRINDTHGHVVGNRVLQKIAGVLSATVRASDLVCRMGGDEFLILCSGFHSREEAETFVKRLQKRVRDVGAGETAWTGISAGMTPVEPGESLETVLGRADLVLYAEKKDRSQLL